MKVSAKIEFPDNSRLFLIEQVFQEPLQTEIINLFQNYTNEPNHWPADERYSHTFRGRLVYHGNNAVIAQLKDFAQSDSFISEIKNILGKQVEFYDLDLWLDKPGYQIKPHYDGTDFDHAVQVYMPYKLEYWQMLGTCVYTSMNPHDALFEMHYRPNAGYLIDKTHTIIHGLNHTIPSQYDRRSVYLRYKSV